MLQLYENIKKRRLELNMSQQELAESVGYKGKSMISQVENGLVDLPESMIMKFASALDTTPSYLMGWEDEDGDLTVLGQLGDSYEKQELLKTLGNYSYDQLAEVVKFLNLFTKATPEVQSAIETLLKSQ
jgi:transcriptional regulator with XRE-family HTH domain